MAWYRGKYGGRKDPEILVRAKHPTAFAGAGGERGLPVGIFIKVKINKPCPTCHQSWERDETIGKLGEGLTAGDAWEDAWKNMEGVGLDPDDIFSWPD